MILSVNHHTKAQLTGTVSDTQNNPLEYATVVLYNESTATLVAGVVTNADGVFTINTIKNGTYRVESSFLGYQTNRIQNIRINDSAKLDLGTIVLRLGNTLDEVTVTGETATVINKIDRQVYLADAFKSAQGGTATDVVRQLPSVTIDAEGHISVRGNSGFVVLLNGKPLQGNASSLMAQLPANAVQSVELITAPSAKYDPDGTAGLINLITTKGSTNGTYGQWNVKSGLPSIETYGNDKAHQRYGSDATYNITNDKWNVSFGANYLRNDKGGRREGDVFTIIDNVFTRFPSTGERSFDETNYNGRLTLEYTPNATSALSIGFFAGKRSKKRLADIVYYDNHKIDPYGSNNKLTSDPYFNHNLRVRKSDFALGNVDYSHTFKNKSELSLSFLYEYTLLGGPTVNQNLGHPDNSVLYQDEYNTNDNPLYGTRAQLDYSIPLKNGILELGYQYRNLDHTGDFVYQRRTNFNEPFVLVPEFSSEVNLRRKIHAVYGQFSITKGAIGYSAGIRLEAMDRTLHLKDNANKVDDKLHYDFTKAYPSASINYAVDKNTNVKMAYSKRVERTTTFKMNPFPEREHSETLEQGDPNLKPEFIDLIELGMDTKMGEHRVFATAYFRNTQNVVNRVNTVYNDSILNRIYSNVGTAKTLGIELGAQLKSTSKWRNFIGANVYRYMLEGSFDTRPVNTNATIFSINANSTYSFWDNATLQFTFNYLSDRVTAQGEDSRYYTPNLTFQKSFLDNRLKATLQWLNMDMGLLNANEQRITTWRGDEFYTTTNYIYEVDMIVLNLSYIFKNGKNKSKFIDSEFGKREF
jgi:iron complex outermembrane receptor protein